MTNDEKKQALAWLCQPIPFDIITIAQHFGMTKDELTNEIRTNTKG